MALLACFLSFTTLAQSAKQRQLEEKRIKLQRDIRQLEQLLFKNQSEKKSVLSQAEDLDQKINVRQELIRVTNQQANLLNREINANQRNITKLRDELKTLKADYAKMISKSYKSKSQQSRIMFLLSSENFLQAYKRLQYMKQYTNYRKQQGDEIKTKTISLQEINKELIKQKKDKEKLIAENRKEQKALEVERKTQEALIASLQKKESSYASQVKRKQQEIDEIDRQIQKLIREAIARSNKKKGVKKSSSGGFALTPADKALAASFKANKGKLPWPLERGVVTLKFGKQRHPVVKTTTIKSNGVRIATEKGAKARCVFDGEVLGIQLIKGSNKTVFVQHGNYVTVYNNLSKVYVKEGQKVKTNQELGEVFTNNRTKKTILKFSIWKDNSPQNPAFWIYKM